MTDDGRIAAPWSWRKAVVESDLDATPKHVLLTLSLHASEKGQSCFPKMSTLADECSLHVDTVKRHLRELRGDWIDWERRYTETGRQTTNLYAFITPEGGGGTEDHPSPEGGQRTTPRGGAEDPPLNEESRGGVQKEDSSSGLRPSPGEPGEEDEGQDDFSREGWIQEVREEDPDTFASALFVEGLRGLLYAGSELPDAAPEGYDLSADLGKLRRRFQALGNEGVAELLLGLSSLREAGELGGVEPGEGLTLGLVNRIDQQMGRSVWSWARNVGREVLHEGRQQGSLLDELTEEVVADVA